MLPVVTKVAAVYHGLYVSQIHTCVQGNLDGCLFIQHNDNIHNTEHVSIFQARGMLVQKYGHSTYFSSTKCLKVPNATEQSYIIK
jgi:hypothetical protein